MKKRTPLIVPVIWFVASGCWAVNLLSGLKFKTDTDALLRLKGLNVVLTLVVAIVGLYRYKKGKKIDDMDEN